MVSEDQQLLTLSVTVKQKKVLLGCLDAYVQHIKNTDNNSILARIYGLYRIRKEGNAPVDLIACANVLKDVDFGLVKYQFSFTGTLLSTAPRHKEFNLA